MLVASPSYAHRAPIDPLWNIIGQSVNTWVECDERNINRRTHEATMPTLNHYDVILNAPSGARKYREDLTNEPNTEEFQPKDSPFRLSVPDAQTLIEVESTEGGPKMLGTVAAFVAFLKSKGFDFFTTTTIDKIDECIFPYACYSGKNEPNGYAYEDPILCVCEAIEEALESGLLENARVAA